MKVKNVTIIRLLCSTWINTPVNYQQLLWSAARREQRSGLAFRSFLRFRESPKRHRGGINPLGAGARTRSSHQDLESWEYAAGMVPRERTQGSGHRALGSSSPSVWNTQFQGLNQQDFSYFSFIFCLKALSKLSLNFQRGSITPKSRFDDQAIHPKNSLSQNTADGCAAS